MTTAIETDRKKKGHHVTLKYPLSIVLIDHPGSGAPDTATLEQWCAAMNKSMLNDFAPVYQILAQWRVDSTAAPDEMVMGLFEHPDQPGALGYHDYTPTGSPYGKVFPKLDAQDGVPLSSTLDHEGKEAAKDLTCDNGRQSRVDGQWWADEPCDAVEQDSYTVDGVTLSNFVLPGWYSGIGDYDFLKKLTKPLSVTPGGYAQYFDPQKGWQQIVHADVGPRSYRVKFPGRREKRRSAFAEHLARLATDAKFNG